jgi:hypothetical protein
VLSKLRAADLTALTGPQVLEHTRGLERLARRTVTAQHAAAAELDARRCAGETGHASTTALLVDLLRIDPGQARRRVRDATEFGPRQRAGNRSDRPAGGRRLHRRSSCGEWGPPPVKA